MAYTYKDDLDLIEDKKKDSKKLTLNALNAAGDMGLDPTYGGDGSGGGDEGGTTLEDYFDVLVEASLNDGGTGFVFNTVIGDYEEFKEKLVNEESNGYSVACILDLTAMGNGPIKYSYLFGDPEFREAIEPQDRENIEFAFMASGDGAGALSWYPDNTWELRTPDSDPELH